MSKVDAIVKVTSDTFTVHKLSDFVRLETPLEQGHNIC